MSPWKLETKAPSWWDEKCAAEKNIFHTSSWQEVLRLGFGASTFYAYSEEDACALTVFKGGPFRIAYTGFPIGITLKDHNTTTELTRALAALLSPKSVHVLRIVQSAFREASTLSYRRHTSLETAISNIQDWNVDHLKKSIRSDLRRAQEGNLIVTKAQSDDDALKLFTLYKETVYRHRGNLRYTQDYFKGLVELSQRSDHIQCFMALEGSTIASFFIAARNTDTCYYIHGGSDMRFQSTRASDLLFSHAIQWAKSQGLQSFNFMSSPYKQKSLVFYKEKWGAETKTQYTYDVPINKVYASLFTIASTSNSLLKKVLNH